jgi:hypothetical protein
MQASAPLTRSAPSVPPALLGSTTPRLWTPPLRELTPETSYGFDEIEFARTVVGIELDPWEQWLSIHAGELLPDGRPRFRTVLALVARQNGKSLWARIKVLYWMFVELADMPPGTSPLILTTSTDRSYAKKFWRATNELIQRNPLLAPEIDTIRLTVSEEATITTSGVELSFAANNAQAGRSRTVHRALVDEVREHRNLDCWGSLTGALNAVPFGQVVCISNQGDDGAMLLDMLRDPALAYLETGEGDPRLGLFEWSSQPGSDPTDLEALAQANPNLGRRVDVDALLGAARRAKRAGGEELASFRTESMCQRVALLDPALDPDSWAACGTSTPIDLAEHRERVALVLEVSLDETHATLIAAATIDGVTSVEALAGWDDMALLRRELPGIVAKVKPRQFGWLPNGPTAALTADLAATRNWPPKGVELITITSELPAICMALPSLVVARKIRHGRDPLLDANVERGQRARRGDTWVFGRRNTGPVDGLYALAGAVHLSRTMPPPRPALVAL